MAILITAPVGTGKTLKCMELALDFLNQGREVYTNIIGIKITGVRVIESNILKPFDWRDLPNGAVLIFDEAHEHPAFAERDLLRNFKIEYWENELRRINAMTDISDTKRKSLYSETEKLYSKAIKDEKEKIMDIGLSMSMHRHFGQEIVLVSQNPTKLNKDVLGNVTIHHVMRRKFGMEAATIWTFGEAMTTWGKSVADTALVKKMWRFPKHLYKFYNSAEEHNVQKYFPKKYYAFALAPILIFGAAIAKGSENGFFGLFGKNEQAQEVPIHPEAVAVELSADDPTKLALDKINAESLGLTVEQYRDLKNPEKRDAVNLSQNLNTLEMVTASYRASDPFDYSYMQAPPVTAHQVFSGCFNGVAYDTQGTILHDAPKDLCKRVMAGDRPFNPYRNNQNAMAFQNYPTEINQQDTEQTVQQVQLTPEEIAKYQQAKEMGLI